MKKLIIAIFVLAFAIPAIVIVIHYTEENDPLIQLQETASKQMPKEQQTIALVEAPENIINVEKKQVTKKAAVKKEPKLIVIDPGHQRYADYRMEAVAPKASEVKVKMPGSTYGVSTGQAEHELTLKMAKQLQQTLQKQGYRVKLTRSKAIVAKSTKERAQYANKVKADLYIQLHADGATNAGGEGLYTIMASSENPYAKKQYKQSQQMGQLIVSNAKKTKLKLYKTGIVHSSSMTALNWPEMPTVIVELGFLNNAKDDQRLAKKSYQATINKVLANSIDAYFKK